MTEQNDTQLAPIAISLGNLDQAASFYANFAEVAFSAYDFTILLGRVPAKFTAEQQEDMRGGTLLLDAEAQVTIAPNLIIKLINALNIAKQSYETAFGTIKDVG